MALNKINYRYFTNKKVVEAEPQVIYANKFNETISLTKNNQNLSFDYVGFKLIKCVNTNKAIKDLLYKNHIESNIKINDVTLKQKDIIIVSAFSRISDILSSRTSGNLHTFLKNKNLIQTNYQIEEFIASKVNQYQNELDSLIDLNLSKCDLINYIDAKDDFIDQTNIIPLLNVLKTYDKKLLVIFNDVDYLKFEEVTDLLPYYNFIYFVNGFEETYKLIQNYQDFLVEYDYL